MKNNATCAVERTKIDFLQFVSIYRKELSNFKTFLDMAKVFPSLPFCSSQTSPCDVCKANSITTPALLISQINKTLWC